MATEQASSEPFAFTVEADYESPWVEEALHEPDLVARSLAELGVPPAAVAETVAQHRDRLRVESTWPLLPEGVHHRAGSDPDAMEELIREAAAERARGLSGFLRDLVGKQEHRVVDEVQREVEVPLIILGSPPVPTSSVEYSASEVTSYNAGWRLKILGTGLGASHTVELRDTGTFLSEDGQHKVVFMPVTMRICKVDVLEKGKKVGSGTRTEMLPEKPGTKRNHAVRLVPADSDLAENLAATSTEHFALAGDTTGAPSVYNRDWKGSTEADFSLGLKAFDVDVSVEAKLTRTREFNLKLTLPGGYDYEMIHFRSARVPDGLAWRLYSERR